jgi:hypothetical protein
VEDIKVVFSVLAAGDFGHLGLLVASEKSQ